MGWLAISHHPVSVSKTNTYLAVLQAARVHGERAIAKELLYLRLRNVK